MHAKEKIVEAADENFWAGIRECYSVCDRFINLENGYFSPQARPVFEAFEGYNKLLNEQTSYFYRVSFPE